MGDTSRPRFTNIAPGSKNGGRSPEAKKTIQALTLRKRGFRIKIRIHGSLICCIYALFICIGEIILNRNKEPEVWIAHSESDCSIARLLSEGLDRQLISVLNDYIEYHLRSGEDEIDVITNSIMQSDIVIALITQLTDAEDVISQIKRARTFKKRLITVLYQRTL